MVLADGAAGPVLDGAADAAGDVELGGDPAAGLADLLVVGAPAGAGHDARDAEGGAEQLGQLEHVVEPVGAAGAAAGADHDPAPTSGRRTRRRSAWLGRDDAGDQVLGARSSGCARRPRPAPLTSAGLASTAWPATVNTAGRWCEAISSIAAPPTTWRVTTNGASPENDSTLAAIDDAGAGRRRAPSARCRGRCRRPAPRPTPAASRTVRIAEAQPAPEYAATPSPPTRCTVRTPYAAELRRRSVARTRRRRRPRRRDAVARGRQVAREGERLEGDLDGRAVERRSRPGRGSLRLGTSTPSFSNRSTTAGAASGPSPRIWTCARRRRRQHQPHPAGPVRLRRPAGAPRSRPSWPSCGPGTDG